MLPLQVALFAAFLPLKVDSRELFVFRSTSRPALHSTSPLVAIGCHCLSVPLVNQSFFAIALLTAVFPGQRRHPILRFFSLATIQYNSLFPQENPNSPVLGANLKPLSVGPKPKTNCVRPFRLRDSARPARRGFFRPFCAVAVCIRWICFIPASSLGFSAFRGQITT